MVLRTALAGLAVFAAATAQANPPGKQVFETQCAVCHGADGNGGEFAPGIVIRLPQRTDADLHTVVSGGLLNRGMPAFKLSEKEMSDLVAYLRTPRPPRRGAWIPVDVTVKTTTGQTLRGVAV